MGAGSKHAINIPSIRIYTLHISFSWHLCGLLQLRKYEAFRFSVQSSLTLQELFEGLKTSFKTVNWSSEVFIEELSFVACFPNPLTHRHTPGTGSGYNQAPKLAGQDLVLHRPLIPCMATYLTEGLDLHTLPDCILENVQQCFFIIFLSSFFFFACLPLFLSFFPCSLHKVMI